jgi:hypothetical protein
VALAVPLSVNPQLWTEYRSAMQQVHLPDMPIPALSVAIRLLLNRHAVWIQFTPEVLACLWALVYFWRRRDRWDWNRDGLLLLLVGVVCTPYGFNSDEAILIPAVLAGLYGALDRGRSVLPLLLLGGLALGEAVAKVPMGSFWYVWTAPAWLGWYLYALHGDSGKAMQPAVEGKA